LIRLSGRNDGEVKIQYTGIRPGEKLHEDLFYESELRQVTQFSKVIRAQSPLPTWPLLRRSLEELQAVAYLYRTDLIRAKIAQLIPEYQCSLTVEPAIAVPPQLAARTVQLESRLENKPELV